MAILPTPVFCLEESSWTEEPCGAEVPNTKAVGHDYISINTQNVGSICLGSSEACTGLHFEEQKIIEVCTQLYQLTYTKMNSMTEVLNVRWGNPRKDQAKFSNEECSPSPASKSLISTILSHSIVVICRPSSVKDNFLAHSFPSAITLSTKYLNRVIIFVYNYSFSIGNGFYIYINIYI